MLSLYPCSRITVLVIAIVAIFAVVLVSKTKNLRIRNGDLDGSARRSLSLLNDPKTISLRQDIPLTSDAPIKPSTVAAATAGSRPCLMSSYSHDGEGHQMEAKLSCIAVAEFLDLGQTYVHIPMNAAEHGENATKGEDFFGIQRLIPSLSSAMLFDGETMEIVPRNPLVNPLRKKDPCQVASWFDDGVRIPACSAAASIQGKVPVFTADNCWDKFYCVLKTNPEAMKELWYSRMIPLLRSAIDTSYEMDHLQTTNSNNNVNSNDRLRVVAHVRRGDARGRQSPTVHFQTILNNILQAWEGRPMDIIIHTDSLSKLVKGEIGIVPTDLINIQVLGKDSQATLQSAFLDMINSDIFLQSESSLSTQAGLYRNKHPSTNIMPPRHPAKMGLVGLGWSMMTLTKDSNSVLMYNHDIWEELDMDFWIGLVNVAVAGKLSQ